MRHIFSVLGEMKENYQMILQYSYVSEQIHKDTAKNEDQKNMHFSSILVQHSNTVGEI
jgi:hypothetical protein